jgi:aspartyl-tRNA(Asn)/glutamyl-tRNA(Gln) amidotransferase subunit B
MDYEAVIGLEVHLQLSTHTKLFCGCPTTFGAAPNSQTCPVCLGLPGVLPVLNERVLEWGIRVALALNCRIARLMKFDRKQYFYPDLPKNYQISQYDQPLAERGWLELAADSAHRRIAIRRVHLEEDAGKLLHDVSPAASCVDFNRAGVPLLEIVSEPELRTPAEAYDYLLDLKAIMEYLDVSTCNMEEGSLRCDTNVSVRRAGDSALGARVEIKNLNSFRAVKLALEHELARQTALLSQGTAIVQETRLWDAKRQQTQPMRTKEDASDYRYFPEPDLVPFVIEEAMVSRVAAALPELPAQRRRRFQDAYALSAYDAQVLTQDRAVSELFEGALRAGASPKPAANWIMGDFLAYANAKGREPRAVRMPPEWLAQLVRLIAEGTLSGTLAKEVFVQALERGVSPEQVVREQGLRQIVDEQALEQIAETVLKAHQPSVDEYLKGKDTVFTYLMGQAMKQSRGKANPQQMAEALRRKLTQAAAPS